MLLLFPPVAKPCEPPASIGALAGALKTHGIPHHTVDLNLYGLLHLLKNSPEANDTWSRRAKKNRAVNIERIRSGQVYNNAAQYQKVVYELNRLLEISAKPKGELSFSNYQDNTFTPVKSKDLLFMAEHPENSVFYEFFHLTLPSILQEHNHDYIALSITYLSQALHAFSLIGYLKKLVPNSKIIIGGGLITSWMGSDRWNDPFRDVVELCVKGCGKKLLISLMSQHNQITTQSTSKKDAFSTQKTEKATLGLCFDHLQNHYLAPGFILPYPSSAGCYWSKCNFCPEKAEKSVFKPLSNDQIRADLQQLKEETNPTLIHFVDNALPPKLLRMFDQSFPAIPWYGFTRITKELTDLDFCVNLKKSGCVMLKLGIESGSQKVLDSMGKGIDLETISRTLQNLKRASIATYVYLLFGTPTESYEDAKKTLEFTTKYHSLITFLNLAIFNMPINSSSGSNSEYDVQTSSFYDGDLSLYTDFRHPHDWTRKNIRLFLQRDFKKNQNISKIIHRDPPFFTSNHAPFFAAQGT